MARARHTAAERRTRAALALAAAGILATAVPIAGVQSAAAAERPRLDSQGRAVIELPVPRDSQDVLRELELERGKSAFVRTQYPVKRVSVGAPDILDVVVLSPRELQLVPKAVGNTNLVLWDPAGQPKAAIDVAVGTAHMRLESELRRVLDSDTVRVDSAGESVVLKGSVPNALAQERAVKVARAFFTKEDGEEVESKVINLLDVGGEQQVMIEVIIAELARTVRRELGTNIISTIRDDGNTIELFTLLSNLVEVDEVADEVTLSDQVNLVGRFFGFGTGTYDVFFNILHDKGLGKILAEPTLVARSGESANFLVGGEVPIPIAQGGAFGSITVEFKQFGVGVAFTPTVLAPDRIHLDVETEVSEPDFAFGTSVAGFSVPAFNTRRAATGVELGDGQSFAIAGLLRDDVNELVSQYPVLGEIPILGALFRSSEFQREETELVLIVTPRLVKPSPPGPRPLPTDFFVEPNAFEFYLLGAIEGHGSGLGAAGASAPAGTAWKDEDGPAPQKGGLIGRAGHQVDVRPHGGS